MLLFCPHQHCTCSSKEEQVGGPIVSHNGEHGPRKSFKEVVRERNKLEGKTVRNFVFSGAVRSQSSQDNVTVQVTDLENDHCTSIPLQFVQRAVCDMINKIPDLVVVNDVLWRVDREGNEQAVDPIMAGVSEKEC